MILPFAYVEARIESEDARKSWRLRGGKTPSLKTHLDACGEVWRNSKCSSRDRLLFRSRRSRSITGVPRPGLPACQVLASSDGRPRGFRGLGWDHGDHGDFSASPTRPHPEFPEPELAKGGATRDLLRCCVAEASSAKERPVCHRVPKSVGDARF